MKILAISDRVDERVYSEHILHNYGDVDLSVGCGDLPYYYLEFIVSMVNQPVLYVHGNHDAEVLHTATGRRVIKAEGCDLIDGRVVNVKGLIFMGLGGSIRYKPGTPFQYTEAQMRARVARLIPRLLMNKLRYGRFVDVVVTHSPPYGIHDSADRAHVGFKVFLTLMAWFKPRFLLHGHMHDRRYNAQTRTTYRDTMVVGVFPVRSVEV
ncbi:MAG: metallophosphoesterase [Anaerolineales bacterium]|nr:MAG: metallophosphoesterase [Anaerolineales bacterium]